MTLVKYLLGIVPAIAVFLLYLGYNLGPVVFLGVVASIGYYLLQERKGSPIGVKTKGKGINHSLPETTIRFEDIGGQEKAKRELMEALDFLIYQEQIHQYGIRPIKGILLDGPPGTGKTLMAKAAANYTDSIFMAASGSEFVEMYVGVGAQRVRQLFNEARGLAIKNKKDSAIIFIDEIDVIGGKREGKNLREYDQTLNQLLTEMDGIQSNESPKILIMAATNRKDMLDSALLRPGRFDRHITVDLPDKKARMKILELHTAKKPIAEDVDLEQIAGEAYGFSGAQLESVTNEAAIYALREKEKAISTKHFSSAIDKVLMGEENDREANIEEKRRVAIHELGHAIIAEFVKPNSVSQVALRPRGQALGYVRHNPTDERYLHTKESIENEIMIALAGSVAEEIFYGHRSTGSRNDFEQVQNYVQHIIEAGLSSLGIINVKSISKDKIDQESSQIIEALLEKTREALIQVKDVIERAVDHLENEEVLTGIEFREMIKNYTDKEKIYQ